MDYFGNRYFGARYYGPQYWGPSAGGVSGGGINGELSDFGVVYANGRFSLRRRIDEDDIAVITALLIGEDK
jgi:hypothetical protein